MIPKFLILMTFVVSAVAETISTPLADKKTMVKITLSTGESRSVNVAVWDAGKTEKQAWYVGTATYTQVDDLMTSGTLFSRLQDVIKAAKAKGPALKQEDFGTDISKLLTSTARRARLT